MKLETKRLILRPLRTTDASDVAANANNLNVSKWLAVVPYPYTIADALWWINKSKGTSNIKKGYSFGIALRSNNRIIGSIGIHKLKKKHSLRTIGYWIGEKHWGKGYGSEALEALLEFAFKELKFPALEASVFFGNTGSGKLLRKYGFKFVKSLNPGNTCLALGGKHRAERIYRLYRKDYLSGRR